MLEIGKSYLICFNGSDCVKGQVVEVAAFNHLGERFAASTAGLPVQYPINLVLVTTGGVRMSVNWATVTTAA